MAKRPSTRTHRMRPLEGLNLTPMIDMIATLMFFLMIFAGILPVVIIDAPLPKVASTADEVRMAKDSSNKLELTIWINEKGFTVKSAWGTSQTFGLSPEGKYPYELLHKALVNIHQRKSDESEVTLIPTDDTSYEVLIEVMDSTRSLMSGDTGYQPVPPDIAKTPESAKFNKLFPDVSIGGV